MLLRLGFYLMLLKINFSIFFLFFLFSCSLQNTNQIVSTNLENENKPILEKEDKTEINKEDKIEIEKEVKTEIEKDRTEIVKNNFPIYLIGDPYFIEGINYTPKEDYNYIKTGLATYYDKELHSKKTVNNELNKVTELYARHKTLPLPSIVKITNLDNGLSLVLRVNDRTQNNYVIIEVSRKVAQLLRFYKEPKLAKVKVEILSEESKQLKIVTQSMSNPDFILTVKSAPTESVSITDLNETDFQDENSNSKYEQPIELNFQEIASSLLFLRVSRLNSYEDTQKIKNIVDNDYKFTTNKENNGYVVTFGPLLNENAYNLLQKLISKGYKNSEIIIK